MSADAQALFGVRRFRDREGSERTVWTRIGTAIPCKDGSWNLVFDYVPNQAGTAVNMRPVQESASRGEASSVASDG